MDERREKSIFHLLPPGVCLSEKFALNIVHNEVKYDTEVSGFKILQLSLSRLLPNVFPFLFQRQLEMKKYKACQQHLKDFNDQLQQTVLSVHSTV